MISFQLATIFAQLQSPQRRAAGSAALAALCGSRHVLLFGKDREIGVFLPAPGLPQTLRDGGRWQSFLRSCAGAGSASADMPDPLDGLERATFGLTDEARLATIVFMGGAPDPEQCRAIAALLPLLGANLQTERMALAAAGHANAAREASRRAGALNTALDINRRELQAAYESVERELVSRREAESRLREADRRKDEFLAMLAHELRNPLAPIGMAAQILKIGPTNPARLQQTCQIIERQVSHMTRLLDDLLDVSRVTGGMVALAQELHDMRQIVEHALEQARPLINARGHHLTLNLVDKPACVHGDNMRLVQIVTNLLNNAAKYTPNGGEIHVKLALRDDEIVFTVRDNGIGIDGALLPHVFELFTQGERSSDRTQGGLGVGLALVKSLAQRHGGAVRARSEGLGRGCEFEVTLPRAAPGRNESAERHGDLPDSSRHSVLIVDDNADAARTLALFLQTRGHAVQVAFDGAQALHLARAGSPRVLLLDIGLPDMDGYALARHLRRLPSTRDCVYIALTGYGCPEDRERSRKAGFDHHLTKPVNAMELASLLGALERAYH